MKFAADEAGVGFEQLSSMASRAAKAVAEIVAKGGTAVQIGRVKVQLTDTAGEVRGLTQLLPDIAGGLSRPEAPPSSSGCRRRIFGRQGGDAFITMLKESGSFMKMLGEQTQRAGILGVIFTDDQVQKLTDLCDAIGRVGAAWLGVKVKLMTEIAPAITNMLNGMAVRVAEMPSLVRSMFLAFRDMSIGNEWQKQQATEALTNYRTAIVGLLKTSAIEMGSVAAVALVETLSFGLRAAAPAISDVFRDALGPVLNSIPGVDIGLSNRESSPMSKRGWPSHRRRTRQFAWLTCNGNTTVLWRLVTWLVSAWGWAVAAIPAGLSRTRCGSCLKDQHCCGTSEMS